MIKAVLFDVDGVLLDSFEANFIFYQKLFKKVGHQPPTREEYKKLFHIHMRGVIQTVTKILSDEEVDKIWEIGKSRKVRYPAELLSIPKKAEEVMEKLHKKYKLGVVTSRQKDSIFESPKLAKLKKYFAIVVSYDDTKNHKPHPDPLLFACTKLHMQPPEIVYIGDSESDFIAAKSAGMKIIMYTTNNHSKANGLTNDFSNIPDLVQRLG